MSDLVAALLLGLIEGLTEFLPISSTGHLLIAQQWLGARSDFFNIVIQAGAILAIVLVFRQRIWMLASGMRQPENRDYSMKVMLAFFTTALVGLPVRMAGWELPDELAPVAWALVLGGVWMLLAEYWAGRRDHCEQVSWSMAVGVGLAQVAAGVFPGTSRSAAAIFLVMLMGLARRSAAEFVFLVGIPTMFAASGYAFVELWLKQGIGAEPWGEVALAFLAATGTGFIVVHWLLGYIKAHSFTGFAIYRIVLGLALLIGLAPGR